MKIIKELEKELENMGRYPPFGLSDDGDGCFGLQFYKSEWFKLNEKEISQILKILILGTKRVQEYNRKWEQKLRDSIKRGELKSVV